MPKKNLFFFASLILFLVRPPLQATDLTVTSTADTFNLAGTLRYAIISVNMFNRAGISDSDENNTITIDSSLAGQTLTLTKMLPLFLNNRSVVKNVIITGLTDGGGNPNFTIDGISTYRGFFTTPRVLGGSVNGVLNITIKDVNLTNNYDIGGTGRGGAAGFGGGLFVGENTNVILENVNFTNCKAQGGNGVATNGGGGMSGGNATASGGGFGAVTGPGQKGGGGLGGTSGTDFVGGDYIDVLGGDNAGGGPAGAPGAAGGNGGFGGGGGTPSTDFTKNAGNGGFGGGGGGTASGAGGNGGFGGGGGQAGPSGGNGGFGGGGARRSAGTALGGFGGGNGAVGAVSNGGCGFGGAIFVQTGGSLTIKSVAFTNSTVGFGTATGAGTVGLADGNDIYLHGTANLTFDIAQDLTLTNPIGGNKKAVNSTGNFIKSGSGKLTLNAAAWPFQGAVTANAGRLAFSTSASLGTGTLALGGGILSPTATLTLNKNITLNPGNSGIEVNGAADNATFQGIISSSGNLEKSGPGTATFSGANSYTGATVITDGTLALSVGGTIASSSSTTISNGATLDITGAAGVSTIKNLSGAGNIVGTNKTLAVNQNVDGIFSGVFSGVNASLVKQGSSTLIMSGINTYSGTTTVFAGTLIVDGSIANSAFTVNSGTTLKGTGPLGNVTISGTLAPGHSIGTINGITFHFLSGSTLDIELNAANASDLVVASTSVTIDEPGVVLNILPEPGAYANGETYTIISSPTITGSFSSVVSSFIRFVPRIDYFSDHINIVLTAAPFINFISPTATNNAKAVASYMDFLDDSSNVASGSDLAFVFSVASNATADQLADGLNTFHAAPYNTLLLAQENSLFDFRSAYLTRLDELITLTCTRRKIDDFSVWITPLGTFAKQRSNDQNWGYHSSLGGFSLGFDRLYQQCFCFGGALGYTNTSVRTLRVTSHGRIDTGYAAIYGRYFNDIFYIDAGITADLDAYLLKRSIYMTSVYETIDRTARGQYHGIDCDSHLGFGATVNDANNGNISFRASMDWIIAHQNGFTEHGADSIDLVVDSKHANLLRSLAGIRFSQCFDHFVPEFGLSGAYDKRFGGNRFDTHFVNEPGAIVVKGLNPSQFILMPEIKMTAIFLNQRMTSSLSVEGEFGNGGEWLKSNLMFDLSYSF